MESYIRTSEGYIFDRNAEEHMNIIKALENEEISAINKFGEIVERKTNIKEIIKENDIVVYKITNNQKPQKDFVKANEKGILQVHHYSLEQIEILLIATRERFEEIQYIV